MRLSGASLYARAWRNIIGTLIAPFAAGMMIWLLISLNAPFWLLWIAIILFPLPFLWGWARTFMLACPRCDTNIHLHNWYGIKFGWLPARRCSECGLDLTRG